MPFIVVHMYLCVIANMTVRSSNHEIWGSGSGVAEDSYLQGCDTVSLGLKI